jgi:hypothetical protein
MEADGDVTSRFQVHKEGAPPTHSFQSVAPRIVLVLFEPSVRGEQAHQTWLCTA